MGVETAGLLNWSFEAQKILRSAQARGQRYDRKAPQLLPLTLVVGPEGAILFTHYGRKPDRYARRLRGDLLPVRRGLRADGPGRPGRRIPAGQAQPPLGRDLTLPDLAGDLTGAPGEEDAISKLFD